MSTKKSDAAAHERATKVRDWIGAQRDLIYTAKEAAAAIFGEGYTKAEQHYVSAVLSKHSTGEDAPVALVGKKHRTGAGGRSDFVYQTLTELPKPRAAFFASKRSHIRGKTSTMRQVNFINNVTPADASSLFIEAARAVATMDEGKATIAFNKALQEKAAMEAAEVTPATAQRLFKEAAGRTMADMVPGPHQRNPEPSVTERLLDIAIRNDRSEPILAALLCLAADIADKGE